MPCPGKQAGALGVHLVELHCGVALVEIPLSICPRNVSATHSVQPAPVTAASREMCPRLAGTALLGGCSAAQGCGSCWVWGAGRDAPCSFPGLLHSRQPRGLGQRWKRSVLGFCAQWAPYSSRIGSSPCPEQLNGIKSKNRLGQNSNPGVCQAGGLAVSLHYLLLLDSHAWSEVLTHICNLPLL